jgi:electron transport complex protein RnfD
MSEPLVVSIGPHIKDRASTKSIMWAVTLSLVPAGAAGVFIFGLGALYVIIAAVGAAVITEAAVLAIRKKDIGTLWDGSAILTGLLLAYNLPPQVPLWIPIVGSVFAIAVGKQVFGGLGHNIFNPALVGRAFLMISWPVYMTTWKNPRWALDAITSATPLAICKGGGECAALKAATYWNLFIGNRGGCIGEVCIIALLIGAAFLFIKRYITWHIPLAYIGTVALFSWIFNGPGFFHGSALFFVLAGGLILGAFFMATDYVTSPLSVRGKIIFGIGCGILTFIIRKYAGYPEGVSYAILIMNAAAPIIDRYTFPKIFGGAKK